MAATHQCCICREDFVEGDVLRMLGCRHVWHSACIAAWIMVGCMPRCPRCKHCTTPMKKCPAPQNSSCVSLLCCCFGVRVRCSSGPHSTTTGAPRAGLSSQVTLRLPLVPAWSLGREFGWWTLRAPLPWQCTARCQWQGTLPGPMIRRLEVRLVPLKEIQAVTAVLAAGPRRAPGMVRHFPRRFSHKQP